MRAWEVRGGELGLHEVQSRCPREGDSVVQVSHVGICGSDVPKLLSPHRFDLPNPWLPGHEIVGTDPTGRTVAVDPLVPCGTCSACAAGGTHLCAELRRLGWDLPGGFAEHVVVPAGNTHPLPPGADPLSMALVDPAAVAVHGVRCNPLGSPGRLAVVGVGTVGLLSALYAHQQGWQVTVVHRDGRAPSRGLTKTIPATFRSHATLTANQDFPVVIDAAVGADPGPLELALRLVGDGGTVVVQNAYHPDVRLSTPLRDIFRRSIRLIGSFSYCRRGRDDFTLAMDLLHNRAAEIEHLVAEAGELATLPSVLAGERTRSVRHVLTVGRP